MRGDHDWTSAHQNFSGAMDDHLRSADAMDDHLHCGDATNDLCRLLGAKDDHLRSVDEGRHRPHDEVGLDDRQICVYDLRRQPMDGLGDRRTCEDGQLCHPLNADAMGAHHLDEAVKDDCRLGVGLTLR
jgi:hypothetical protein